MFNDYLLNYIYSHVYTVFHKYNNKTCIPSFREGCLNLLVNLLTRLLHQINQIITPDNQIIKPPITQFIFYISWSVFR